MPNVFNRKPQAQKGYLFNGIDSFAPEFWRLIADAAPSDPSSPPNPPGAPSKLPLTNHKLRDFRESLGGFADSMQDIPPSPPPPAELPKITNDALRSLRDPEAGSGDLMDIPREVPRAPVAPDVPNPETDRWMSYTLNKLKKLRGDEERMVQERVKPERARDARAFDEEIARTRKQIDELENEIGNGLYAMPGYRQS